VDADAYESEKAAAEAQQMEDGELLSTGIPSLEKVGKLRTLYDREKLRAITHRKERQLSGKDWVLQKDGATGHPFWYNTDSGEGVWEPPLVLKQMAGEANARAGGYALLSLDHMVNETFLLLYTSPCSACFVFFVFRELFYSGAVLLALVDYRASNFCVLHQCLCFTSCIPDFPLAFLIQSPHRC